MKEIELNNPEVKEILNNFLQWFRSIDTNLIKLKGNPDTNEYYTGEEYFEEVNKPDHVGFPEDSYGQDLTDIEATPIEWRDKIRKLDDHCVFANTSSCISLSFSILSLARISSCDLGLWDMRTSYSPLEKFFFQI